MEHSANILLLGKTGVGESSFINYFLGKNVAETGVGMPVTQKMFIPYEIPDGRYPIQIFDTRGMEALNANSQVDDANSQVDDLIAEIKWRNNSDDIFGRFHTIFYCISMSNPRFEDFEATFIRKLQKNPPQHIHIILTHCDTCSAENIAHMRQRIASALGNLDNIEIFEVVCVSKKKRNGTTVEPRGREAVSERVFDLLLEDIAYTLSASYAKELHSKLVNGVERMFSEFEGLIDKLVRFKTLVKFIQDENDANAYMDGLLDNKAEELEREMERVTEQANKKFEEILKPAAQLFQSYHDVVTNSFVQDAGLGFDDMTWDIDTSALDSFGDEAYIMHTIAPKLARKYMDENGDFVEEPQSFFELMGAIGAGVHDLFHLKKNLKKAIREKRREFIRAIPSEDDFQKEAYERIVDIIGG